jgi:osmoprotectant transport system permease protein
VRILGNMSLIEFLVQNRDETLKLALEHLFLVAVSTGAAVAVGAPVGVLLTRRPALSKPVLAIANVLQTIPSLALFGFLIPLLGTHGIGRVPAILALFLYSLLPIIRNTFTGINGVDPGVREAARGMGMTDWQILTKVEMPLSMSVIIAGVRVATVISIGTATIAAAIGAGGLGTYIFRGLRMNDNNLILAGAVPAALMALAADWVLGWIEKTLTPGARPRALRQWTPIVVSLLVVAAFYVMVRGGHTRSTDSSRRVVIGSKDFTEQVILGEMLAQVLEGAGLEVERRFELGGDLCHRAMLSGEIDGYPEYSGTAFIAILKHQPLTDPREVYNRVKEEYDSKFGIAWLDQLGFEDTFAILIRGEDQRRLGVRTISESAAYTPRWRAAFGQDFMSRGDGYPGLVKAYGLRFAEPSLEMDLSLTYRALAAHQIDLIAGNSTDGLITKLDLYQLADDKHFFPPYEAAPLFRRDTLERHPDISKALESIAGKVTNDQMRQLNYAVDGEHRAIKDVVREFLSDVGK